MRLVLLLVLLFSTESKPSLKTRGLRTVFSTVILSSAFFASAAVAAGADEGTTGFFDFQTKLKNNDANKAAAKAAESAALSKEYSTRFKQFENNAIQELSKEDSLNVVYVDKKNGFVLNIPPSWTKLPKSTPTPSMERYQEETVMLVGNSFVEGASLSVTRSQPVRLLKDFNVEWWFAPLNKMGDMGDPEFVARLLILQRQGEFEKKVTASEIVKASIDGNVLEFEFVTPLAQEVKRKTVARAIFTPPTAAFPPGRIDIAWISALSGVFDSEYGTKLYGLRESFALTQ